MHTQPVSLFIAATCGIGVAWICALGSGLPPMIALASVFTTLAVGLIALSVWLQRDPERIFLPWLEDYYPIGAFAYATLVGLIAAAMMPASVPADLRVLSIVYAVAYSSGVCFRSAGRPLVAVGQLACVLIPIVVTSLAANSMAYTMLAIMLLLYGFSMSHVTLRVFQQMSEQILAADSSMKHAAEMREQARTDQVTGLHNRTGFSHLLDLMAGTLPEGEKIVLIWLDLRRFKEVNETLGHRTGDRILAETARRLRTITPERGLIARFGSDEFLVAARTGSRVEAEAVAALVQQTLDRSHRVDGKRIESGASVGAALLPDDADRPEALLQAADLALFHAKAQRLDRVCFFEHDMTRELARRKELEDELRSAIQKDELAIFFQPIVDLSTGRIRKFEALVRWFHPDKGEIAPGEFIPVAEDTGLIITLGNWITAQAAKAAATWPDDVVLSVNLSPAQIKAPGAALGIKAALRGAGLAPGRLELEVTESLFVEDNASTAAFMTELGRQGVRFSLDDFGTGYSSLHYVNRYPFSTIKVDRSFISGPNTGRRSDAIVRAVAEMGRTLDMEIVAEGLETLDQVQSVRRARCTLGQGYYFSRAVPDYLALMLLAQEREPTGEHLALPRAVPRVVSDAASPAVEGAVPGRRRIG